MTRPTDWHELYRATIAPLYRFVSMRTGGRRELAEDAVQETYLRALAAWRKGRRFDRPLTFLQTIAHNILRNHYRRARPLESLSRAQLDTLLDPAPDPADRPDATAAALLPYALARLHPKEARLLEGFHLDGASTKRLAADSGLTERAVEARLRRARLKLRRILEPFIARKDDERGESSSESLARGITT